MAQAFAIYQRKTEIAPLVGLADIYLTEDHERQVTKSRYPVESGASLTDHAVREPDRLKIQGHTGHLSTADPALGNQPDRPAAAWSEIDRLMNARELVEVATILGVYSNMLITRAVAPVSNQTGRDLLFTLELEQVQTEVLGAFTFDPAPGGPAVGRSGTLQRGNEASIDIQRLVESGSIVLAVPLAEGQDPVTPDGEGLFDQLGRLPPAVGGIADASGTLVNDLFSDIITPEGLDVHGALEGGFTGERRGLRRCGRKWNRRGHSASSLPRLATK